MIDLKKGFYDTQTKSMSATMSPSQKFPTLKHALKHVIEIEQTKKYTYTVCQRMYFCIEKKYIFYCYKI